MNPLLAILAPAILIYAVVLAVRGSLALGCILFLVSASCFGGYFFSFDIGGVTLTLDRLLIVALAAALVVQWKLGAVASRPLLWLDWALLALVGWLTASALAHDWTSGGPERTPVLQHLINGYWIPLCVYWIARLVKWDERNTTAVLAALTVFGLYLAVTGICEAFELWAFVFPRYIADPDLSIHFGRARGPMLHSVTYGFYLIGCMMAAWVLAFRLGGRWQAAILLAVPLFLAAIYFTKTRTVWAGAGCVILLAVAVTLHGKLRWAVVGGLVTAGLVVGIAKMDAIIGLEREGTVADTRRSASMRASFTYVSWKMFLDRPLVGFGFGQFAEAKKPYLTDHEVDLQLEAIRPYEHHNTFLSILTETGLVGLALLLAVLCGWGGSGWRLLRSGNSPAWAAGLGLLSLGLLTAALWQMIGHEITFTSLDMSLLMFTAGAAVAVGQAHAASEQPTWQDSNVASRSRYEGRPYGLGA